MRSDEHDPNARHLKARSRFPVSNCTIRYTDNSYDMAETAEPTESIRSAIRRYVNENPGCSLSELRQGVGVGSYQAKAAMATALVQEGVLREDKGPRSARLFYPVETSVQPVPPLVQGILTGRMT